MNIILKELFLGLFQSNYTPYKRQESVYIKKFYLYTEKYKKELEDWLTAEKQNIFIDKDSINNLNCFTIDFNNFNMSNFSDLLQKIVLTDNPITKNSSKIREIVIVKGFNNFEKKVREDITNHFLVNNDLNLDGYIKFYLKDYADYINTILYSIVKKCLVLS